MSRYYWYTRQDLNLRPLGSKPSTLSTELRVRIRGNYNMLFRVLAIISVNNMVKSLHSKINKIC